MTVPSLFIHIGVPKSGSTSIQRVFSTHRDELQGRGLLYPAAGLRGYGHHDFPFLLNGGYPEWAKPQDATLADLSEALRTECDAFDGDILISSENFYLFPQPEALARWAEAYGISNGRQVKIVVYLRRQDELLLSWYNQLVKAQGFAGTFEEALEDARWLGDYATQLQRWSSVFGESALMVRSYHDEFQVDGDLIKDFFRAVSLSPSDVPAVDALRFTNISLNRDILEFQRIINRLPLSSVEKRNFHHELMELTSAAPNFFSSAPLLSTQNCEQLLSDFHASNQQVSADHFEDRPFYPKIPPSGTKQEPYEGLDAQTAVAVMGWLLLRRH